MQHLKLDKAMYLVCGGGLQGSQLLRASSASTDPVDNSAQAALAPHQTTEQEESADTTFMVM
jgi:hypothetical protein